MNDTPWKDDTLTIRGKNIPVKTGQIEHSRLMFYAENPRIYSIVRAGNMEQPSQEEIQEKLLSMEHVKTLVQDIKGNGGLMDPVIVKDGTFEVLEGNSRLAAYRFLSKKDPIQWGRMRCTLLPLDIHDDDVFALLGQYHIKGKKDWAPFEQAGFLYRRHKNQGVRVSDLGTELGIGRLKVSQLIETYEFMIKHNDNDISRWSYYEEYVKSNRIKKVREKSPEFDEKFTEMVKSGEIGRAVDVREKLQTIASGPEKVIQKLLRNEISFDDACDHVVDSGNSDNTYRKLYGFRLWLASGDTIDTISDAPNSVKKKVKYEIEKLQTLIARISKQLVNPQENNHNSSQQIHARGTPPTTSKLTAPSKSMAVQETEQENDNPSGDQEAHSNKRTTMKDILDAGLVVAPVILEVRYKKQTITAQVESDGTITLNGQTYSSPSAAGAAACHTQSCPGWTFWDYRDQNGQLNSLNALRKALRKITV